MNNICRLLAYITTAVAVCLAPYSAGADQWDEQPPAAEKRATSPVINSQLGPAPEIDEYPPPEYRIPFTRTMESVGADSTLGVLRPRAFIPLITKPPESWLNIGNRAEVRDNYLNYYASGTVASGWTGNHAACVAGTTSTEFRNTVLRRINFFRAMAGVPAHIIFTSEYNTKTQAAALIMSRNTTLSHSPSSSWWCYTSAGAEGAGNSNLALGIYGPSAISEYMGDKGGGNYAVGHRRWILYPQTQEMGTGDTPPVDPYRSANALWVLDDHVWDARPPTRDSFVAWPPPGYVPYQIVYPRWSFSYPDADFATASVTMSSGGNSVSVIKASVVNGYGENTLVWIPLGLADGAPWPVPSMDTTYHVVINNVKVAGQTRSFVYDVTVFAP